MLTDTANGTTPLSFWPRVREFAVPASMIETATARRRTGDWAGACAAANFDLDLDLKALARTHGSEAARHVRADLRHLAPDLLRWHMPRIAPDGLLRPGLTVPLARYEPPDRNGPSALTLVVRTAPAWADGGQRISLALWDGGPPGGPAYPHPHPHPSRRFRFDLHRHLWDARRTGELPSRSGALDDPEPDGPPFGRWAAEARILLRSEGRTSGDVAVRAGGRRYVVAVGARAAVRITEQPRGDRGGPGAALPLLPDAAADVPPDLLLLRAGAIEPGRLHPLVAAALVPDRAREAPPPAEHEPGRPRTVVCRGARHRIALVDGVLSALDHSPAEVRREELLAALSGTPLPCLRAIDDAHRHPEGLSGVRDRLDHGDAAGALAVVEGLLGPAATLRDGALRDALEDAARRRITYGLYRAGLIGPRPRQQAGRAPRRIENPRTRPRRRSPR